MAQHTVAIDEVIPHFVIIVEKSKLQKHITIMKFHMLSLKHPSVALNIEENASNGKSSTPCALPHYNHRNYN